MGSEVIDLEPGAVSKQGFVDICGGMCVGNDDEASID